MGEEIRRPSWTPQNYEEGHQEAILDAIEVWGMASGGYSESLRVMGEGIRMLSCILQSYGAGHQEAILNPLELWEGGILDPSNQWGRA